jgi:hypothetical protein
VALAASAASAIGQTVDDVTEHEYFSFYKRLIEYLNMDVCSHSSALGQAADD